MLVYRIANSAYIQDLSGFGASKTNNRWNSKGTSLLYTSTARSLSFLEILAHVPISLLAEIDFSILTLDVDEKQLMTHTDLLQNWKQTLEQTRKIGNNWVANRASVGLLVPSAIINEEYNLLLNPSHEEFNKAVKIAAISKFYADKRFRSLNFSE